MKWKLTELTSIRAFFQFEFLIAASILFRVLNSSYEFWLSKESYEHHKSDLSKDIDREETIGTHFLSDDMNKTTKQSGMEVFQKTKKCNIGPSNPTSKYLAQRIRSEVFQVFVQPCSGQSCSQWSREKQSSKRLLSEVCMEKVWNIETVPYERRKPCHTVQHRWTSGMSAMWNKIAPKRWTLALRVHQASKDTSSEKQRRKAVTRCRSFVFSRRCCFSFIR